MQSARPVVITTQQVFLFLGVFVLLVLILGLWSRLLARVVRPGNLHRSMRRFSRAVSIVRMLIPAWFAVGVCVLGWKDWIFVAFGVKHRLPAMELPYTILGTLPAFAAWVGLWWAQYP